MFCMQMKHQQDRSEKERRLPRVAHDGVRWWRWCCGCELVSCLAGGLFFFPSSFFLLLSIYVFLFLFLLFLFRLFNSSSFPFLCIFCSLCSSFCFSVFFLHPFVPSVLSLPCFLLSKSFSRLFFCFKWRRHQGRRIAANRLSSLCLCCCSQSIGNHHSPLQHATSYQYEDNQHKLSLLEDANETVSYWSGCVPFC